MLPLPWHERFLWKCLCLILDLKQFIIDSYGFFNQSTSIATGSVTRIKCIPSILKVLVLTFSNYAERKDNFYNERETVWKILNFKPTLKKNPIIYPVEEEMIPDLVLWFNPAGSRAPRSHSLTPHFPVRCGRKFKIRLNLWVGTKLLTKIDKRKMVIIMATYVFV